MQQLASLSGYTPGALAFMTAIIFGAAMVRGLTGFGMAIILVPLLALVIQPVDAAIVGVILQVLIGPVGLPDILRQADRRSAFGIAGIGMLTTPLGLLFLAGISPDAARMLIAVVAIGGFFLVLMPQSANRSQPGWPVVLAIGTAAGFLNGFAAMPGPPVVPFYMRYGFSSACARASMMLIFALTALAGTITALVLGTAGKELFLLSAILFVPMVVGNWLGGMAFGRLSPALWRGALALVLGGAAVSAGLRLIV